MADLGSGFRVPGSGFRVPGSGFRVFEFMSFLSLTSFMSFFGFPGTRSGFAQTGGQSGKVRHRKGFGTLLRVNTGLAQAIVESGTISGKDPCQCITQGLPSLAERSTGRSKKPGFVLWSNQWDRSRGQFDN